MVSNECKIKEAIRRLYSEWTWGAISGHLTRKAVIHKLEGDVGGIVVRVASKGGHADSFKINHKRENGDARIWVTTKNYLVQWRTSPDVTGKGNRLVVRSFSKGASTDRLPVEDLFLDPLDVDSGEIMLLGMMYPELAEMLPLFPDALNEFDAKLFAMYKPKK